MSQEFDEQEAKPWDGMIRLIAACQLLVKTWDALTPGGSKDEFIRAAIAVVERTRDL